ncbi:hypothetical protein ABK040_013850 [Willaertia magna]
MPRENRSNFQNYRSVPYNNNRNQNNNNNNQKKQQQIVLCADEFLNENWKKLPSKTPIKLLETLDRTDSIVGVDCYENNNIVVCTERYLYLIDITSTNINLKNVPSREVLKAVAVKVYNKQIFILQKNYLLIFEVQGNNFVDIAQIRKPNIEKSSDFMAMTFMDDEIAVLDKTSYIHIYNIRNKCFRDSKFLVEEGKQIGFCSKNNVVMVSKADFDLQPFTKELKGFWEDNGETVKDICKGTEHVSSYATHIVYLSDGTLVTAFDNKNIKVWNLEVDLEEYKIKANRKQIIQTKDDITALQADLNKMVVGTSTGTLHIFHYSTVKEKKPWTLLCEDRKSFGSEIKTVLLKDEFLIIGTSNGKVYVHDFRI